MDITAGNALITSANAIIFNIDGDITLQATSAVGDIWADAELIRVDRGDGNILLQTTSDVDGTVALSTTGTIQSFSNTFATESNSLVFFSIENISLKPVNDFKMTGSRSWSVLASAGVEYISKDTIITAQAGNINFEVFGKSYVNTVFNNIVLNADTEYNFLSGQTLFQGSQYLEILGDDLIIDANEYLHFKAATDIYFTSSGIQANSTELFTIQSNEHTTINAEDSYIGALRDLEVFSSGDISFVDSIDITQETLGNLRYFVDRQVDIESSDSTVSARQIFANAQETIHFASVATTDLNANDLQINAFTDFTFKAGGSFTVDSPTIVFSTDLSGGIEFYTSDNSVDITSSTFSLTSAGNAVFSSTEDTFVSTTFNTVSGQDIINSAHTSITFANGEPGSSLLLTADNIYANLPTLISTDDLDIAAPQGVSITTGTLHQKSVIINTSDLSDDHQSVTINGGAVNFNIGGDFVLGINSASSQLQDVTYLSGNEKDIIFHSGSTLTFDAGSDFEVYGGNIGTYASFTMDIFTSDLSFEADERFDITSDDLIDITAPYLLIEDFKQFNSFSEEATTISTNDDLATEAELVDLFATVAVNIDAFSYGLTTTEAHYYHDLWEMDIETDITMESTFLSFYFEDISLNQPAFRIHTDHLEMNSVNRIQFKTEEQDVTVTTSTVEITTPLLSMTASNSFDFTGGDVTLGSSRSTPANRNLYNVLISVGGTLTQETDNLYSLKAVGNDEYEQFAVWFNTLGSTSFEALTDYTAAGDNGIDVTLSDSYDSYSAINQHLVATDGSVLVNARQPNLDGGSNTIDYIANGGDFRAEADLAQINFRAGTNIDSSAIADYTYQTTKQLTFETTTEHSSLAGDIHFNSVDDQSWSAGQALHIFAGSDAVGEITSDISGTIGTTTTIQVGKDILFRSLGNEIPGATGGNQILFQSGQITPAVVDQFTVTVTNGPISFFTSGEHALTAIGNTLFRSTAGDISFGSKSNEFDVLTQGSFINQVGDTLYTEAHGVLGNVEFDIAADGFIIVANNYTNVALGSIKVSNGGATVTATNLLLFDTNYHQGSITTHADNVLYEAILHDIILTGKNLQSVNFGSLSIDSPIVNFGKDNVYTPQFTAFLDDFSLTSVGDISISASNSNVTLSSLDSTSYESDNNAVITSGGIVDFAATGPIADSSLVIDSTVITFTAADAIQKVIEGSGTVEAGTPLLTTSTISLLSKGSKTANGFIVESENSVGIDAPLGEFQQKIVTSATINTGSADVTFVSSLSSSSTSLNMNSDNKISFIAASALVETTAQSGRIEFVTEGENSNIEWGVRGTLALSSNDDLFFISNSFHQTVVGAATLSATGSNSGKVQIDASDTITFESSRDLLILSQDDVYISAEGEDTIISFAATATMTNTANEISYTTDADEGGSIFFNIESADDVSGPIVSIDTDDWVIDIDGDINTQAHFFSWESDEHSMAVFGYLDIFSVSTLVIEYKEDGYVTAELADVYFESVGDSVFDFTTLTATATALDVTVRGNQTNQAYNYLSFDSNLINFEATNGKMTWNAYDDITLTTGATKFHSDYVSTGKEPGINVFSTYPAADITFDSDEDFTAYGANVFISAEATEPESGYVKFVQDDTQFGASGFQAYAGEQVEIISEYGNIRYEYSTNLEVIGGDIHGIAGRAIEFNVRGDGGPIINDPFATIQGKYAISFEHLNSVQFETESGGNILVESENGSINLIASLFLARSDTDNLYLESTGNIAIYTTRDDMFAGIEFKSTGNIELYTYDDEIYATCEDLVIIAPGRNSLIQFYAEADGKIDYEINAVDNALNPVLSTFIALSELSVLAQDGDVNIRATCDDCDNSIDFVSANTLIQAQADIYYQYYNNLVFDAGNLGTITIRTEPTNAYFSEANTDGIITLAGKRNSVFNNGDDNTGPDSQVPRVIFPPVIRFTLDATRTNVIQGGFCAVDRQMAFGRTSEFPIQTNFVFNGDFCICSDNVWACIPAPPVGQLRSSYSYQSYNSDISSQ